MRLVDRYILRAHVGPFIFGASIVIFLYLMQFLMKTLDKLVGKGLSEWVIFQFIVYNMSWMVVLAVPMATLFSTLMAFGSLSAAHEVTIIKASGGSLLRMMLPVVIVGAMLTFGLFYFNDVILPETNHQVNLLRSDIQRKKPTFAIEAGKFASEIDGYTIFSRKVDSLTGMLFGVTIYDQSKPMTRNIVSADTGTLAFSPDYSKLILKLRKGEIHQMLQNKVNNYKIINFDFYEIALNADGFAFERSNTNMSSRTDREMQIKDMQLIVDEAKSQASIVEKNADSSILVHFNYLMGKNKFSAGSVSPDIPIPDFKQEPTRQNALNKAIHRLNVLSSQVQSEAIQIREYKARARQYTVEIQKKYAIPFACLLFVLVGCPLGIITKGGNFGFSAIISLGFYIFYWATLIGGEKLADRGIMDPVISMWLGNIIIAILGILLTLKVNFESLDFLGIGKIKRIIKRK